MLIAAHPVHEFRACTPTLVFLHWCWESKRGYYCLYGRYFQTKPLLQLLFSIYWLMHGYHHGSMSSKDSPSRVREMITNSYNAPCTLVPCIQGGRRHGTIENVGIHVPAWSITTNGSLSQRGDPSGGMLRNARPGRGSAIHFGGWSYVNWRVCVLVFKRSGSTRKCLKTEKKGENTELVFLTLVCTCSIHRHVSKNTCSCRFICEHLLFTGQGWVCSLIVPPPLFFEPVSRA